MANELLIEIDILKAEIEKLKKIILELEASQRIIGWYDPTAMAGEYIQ